MLAATGAPRLLQPQALAAILVRRPAPGPVAPPLVSYVDATAVAFLAVESPGIAIGLEGGSAALGLEGGTSALGLEGDHGGEPMGEVDPAAVTFLD